MKIGLASRSDEVSSAVVILPCSAQMQLLSWQGCCGQDKGNRWGFFEDNNRQGMLIDFLPGCLIPPDDFSLGIAWLLENMKMGLVIAWSRVA